MFICSSPNETLNLLCCFLHRSELMTQVSCMKESWLSSVALAAQRRTLTKEQLSQWRIFHRGLKLLWKLLRDVDPLLPPAGPALCTLQQLRSCTDDYQVSICGCWKLEKIFLTVATTNLKTNEMFYWCINAITLLKTIFFPIFVQVCWRGSGSALYSVHTDFGGWQILVWNSDWDWVSESTAVRSPGDRGGLEKYQLTTGEKKSSDQHDCSGNNHISNTLIYYLHHMLISYCEQQIFSQFYIIKK